MVGIEVAEQAITEFFIEHGLKFVCENVRDFKLFKSADDKIRIYMGDFFKFDRFPELFKIDHKNFTL